LEAFCHSQVPQTLIEFIHSHSRGVTPITS
jgi:hypothetical protein